MAFVFTITNYHLLWWNYSEDANKTESIGPTCGIACHPAEYGQDFLRL